MDSKICLTCLCKPAKAHNINEIILENLNILETIQQLVPLLLEQKEFTLPNTICAECLKKLIMSFNFQKQCLDSIRKLRRRWSEKLLDKQNEQEVSQLKCEDMEFESNKLKTGDENTVESLSEIQQNVEISVEFNSLSTNKEDIVIFEENHVESTKDDLNDILQCNENSNKNETCEAFEMPIIAPRQCKLCSKIFKQPQGLASHMSKTHLKKHLYQCRKCDKGFSVEELFIRHCNLHLGIKPFPCTQCDKAFDTRSTLNQHLLCHSKESSYICTICGKKFYRIDVYKQHMQRHDDKEQFQCLKCDINFKSFSDHIKHIKAHKTQGSHECNNFNKNFPTCNQKNKNADIKQCDKDSVSNLKLHQKTKKHQCTSCLETFYRSTDLEIHTRRIHEETKNKLNEESTMNSFLSENEIIEMPLEQILTEFKPESKDEPEISIHSEKIKNKEKTEVKVEENTNRKAIDHTKHQRSNSDLQNMEISSESAQCDLCNQIFKNSQGLARHRSSTHFKKHLYQCDQCDRGFSVEEYYIKHRNRHLGIKTFKCKQCDKAFETNSILNQHLISHSKVTPHLCTTCGKSFRRLDGLRQHMLRHGDERPFKCSVCSKSFKCLSDKLKHSLIHDEKRYECNICGSRLATPDSLSQHQMTHTGEKPFKCTHCEKCFISLSNMRCHERIHTGEKPYRCQYCCKSFRQSNDRKKHTNRMHKNEMINTKPEINGEILGGNL